MLHEHQAQCQSRPLSWGWDWIQAYEVVCQLRLADVLLVACFASAPLVYTLLCGSSLSLPCLASSIATLPYCLKRFGQVPFAQCTAPDPGGMPVRSSDPKTEGSVCGRCMRRCCGCCKPQSPSPAWKRLSWAACWSACCAPPAHPAGAGGSCHSLDSMPAYACYRVCLGQQTWLDMLEPCCCATAMISNTIRLVAGEYAVTSAFFLWHLLTPAKSGFMLGSQFKKCSLHCCMHSVLVPCMCRQAMKRQSAQSAAGLADMAAGDYSAGASSYSSGFAGTQTESVLLSSRAQLATFQS